MELEQFGRDIVRLAIEAGAEEAEVFIQSGRESEITTRMTKLENVKQSTSEGYGIRAFRKRQLGFCFSSDFTFEGMREAARRAVVLSRESSADEFNGLPEASEFIPDDLDLYDKANGSISGEEKIEACKRMEQAVFEYDKRVTNSEGAAYYDGETNTVLVNSHGISMAYRSSYNYLACRPVASENAKLQGGWWYSYKRHLADLEKPEDIGRKAAERAVRMLGARVPATAKVPVVFDRLTGISLLAGLAQAIDGDEIYKRASFLAGKLGQRLCSPAVTIIDDGTLAKGLASAPFDGEGMRTSRRRIVADGTLESYLYDTYTARKAKTESTSSAQRDRSSLPSIGTHNLYMQAGEYEFDRIIGEVTSGLYLTGLMGSGVNAVTGDYSLGASGIWIENGELAYPVESITIASNILDMLAGIDMIGNDLEFSGPYSCPTFRVAEMTVSGRK